MKQYIKRVSVPNNGGVIFMNDFDQKLYLTTVECVLNNIEKYSASNMKKVSDIISFAYHNVLDATVDCEKLCDGIRSNKLKFDKDGRL